MHILIQIKNHIKFLSNKEKGIESQFKKKKKKRKIHQRLGIFSLEQIKEGTKANEIDKITVKTCT